MITHPDLEMRRAGRGAVMRIAVAVMRIAVAGEEGWWKGERERGD